MTNTKKPFIICLVFIAVLTVICSSYFVSFAADSDEDEIMFSGYNKIGDKVKVINAPYGTSYSWKVTSQITGDVLKMETNSSGEFTILESYNESIVQCYVASEDIVLTMYVSTLPVMYIDSETEYVEVNKEEYSDVNLKLVGNKKYTDSSLLYNGTGNIKLRGNSTADREKKPFRLKLDKSANLLNLGKEDDGKVYKSKHWVLLANDMDHTLMRNKLLYDLSGDMGFEYYFNSTNVVLMYNGEYMGVYQLCEHRRVDEGRINITDWVSLGEDIAESIASKEWKSKGYDSASDMEDDINEVMYQDYSWIDNEYVVLNGKKYTFSNYGHKLPNRNGGFLAELDFLSMGSNTIANIDTAYGLPFYVNHPEAGEDADDIVSAVNSFKNTSLYKYADKYTQSFEYALHSKNFIFNSGIHYMAVWPLSFSNGTGWKTQLNTVNYVDKENNGKHYSELFDMNSLVNYFLFNEFIDNYDTMKTSAFFYKDVDEIAKMGPMWDFDLTLGNITSWISNLWFPAKWHTTNEVITVGYQFQSYNWFRLLIKDPYFLVKAYERYHEIRPIIEEIVKDGGLVDQYTEYLKYAGLANEARWAHTYVPENYGGGEPLGFKDSIDRLNEFLDIHVDWLDRQFKSIETLIKSLGYYEATSDIDFEYNGNYIKVKSTNKNCNNVEVQVNGKHLIKANLVNGEALVEIPAKYLYTTDKYNVIVVYEKNGEEYILNKSLKPSSNYEHIARSVFKYFKTKDIHIEKTELKTEINSISSQNKYTAESWEEFKAAYAKAKTILNDKKSMQEDIDKCLLELKAAKSKLVLAPISDNQNENVVTPNDDIIVTPSDDYFDEEDNNNNDNVNDTNNNNNNSNNDAIDNNTNIEEKSYVVYIVIGVIVLVAGIVSTIIIINKKKKIVQ